MKDCYNCLHYNTCYYLKKVWDDKLYFAFKKKNGNFLAEICHFYEEKEE